MKKILFFILIIFSFSGCLFTGGTEKSVDLEVKSYRGIGEDQSLMKAINKAKIMAIRKAVVDLIGVYSEQANQDVLNNYLYKTNNPNAYVENSQMKVLQKYKTGEKFFCEIDIPVKLKELRIFLDSHGISSEDKISGSGQGNSTNNLFKDEKNKKAPIDAEKLLEKEKALAKEKGNAEYLDHYLKNLTFMVFSAQDSVTEEFLLKSAVQMANSYLIQQGYRVVDYETIEKLKRDNTLIYEESTSSGFSLIQLIAQKLNADVYLEIDSATEGGSNYDAYYGSAKVTVKIFNPSTGELLGSVPYSSQKTYSRVSQYDAQSNALQSTVYKVLPLVEDQAKLVLAKAYSEGIRYELIINNTHDPRLMSRFRKALALKVNDVKIISQSKEQTKYAVYNFSEVDEIMNIVYEIAENDPSFSDLELVLLRGKSLTFLLAD